MTCIAAIQEKGIVYIGGDSAGVDGYNLILRADEKVWKNKEIVCGFTSSFRMGQLLRYTLQIPQQPDNQSDTDFMSTTFIGVVRECLKIGGFAKVKDNVETGGTFIVGYKGNIYHIEDDFQVGRPIDNFAATGCGSSYALGVLWEMRNKKVSPVDKITSALLAAEHFSAGVRKPFKIISSK